MNLQLGIVLERTREIGFARHAVLDAVDAGSVRTDQQRVIARLVGRQRVVEAGGRNGEGSRADRHFLEPRLVFVDTGLLFGEHRNVPALDLENLHATPPWEALAARMGLLGCPSAMF